MRLTYGIRGGTCTRKPPRGWKPCTRGVNHPGPCALWPAFPNNIRWKLRFLWQDLRDWWTNR